jgi:hypothetical protein
VLQPVALRESARKLVLADRTARQQHLLRGRLAWGAGGLDRLVGLRLGHEPELDEDVA